MILTDVPNILYPSIRKQLLRYYHVLIFVPSLIFGDQVVLHLFNEKEKVLLV